MKNTIKILRKKQLRNILDGQSMASVSREIGVNENTIHKWKQEILSVNGEIDQEKLAMRKRIIELEASLAKGFSLSTWKRFLKKTVAAANE